ncbi:MAG: TIGR00282 family metallophosphoesterase [Candidatus Omnitrophica bacterium]|nr:TIGR00282 family metallophosphoesterase [Candidatus Omnitrophota bacterium]
MRILCLGDVVGQPGRFALQSELKNIIRDEKIDFVIANGENVAGGAGLTSRLSRQCLEAGCDVLTLGDHAWDQKEIEEYLKITHQVIRPANFPDDTPGKGWCIKETKSGVKVGVISLLGRVFIRYYVDCPFRKLKSIISEIKKQTSIIIVDLHAEATSEKIAFGHFADGEVSAVLGTHTHVQTADEAVLPKGTAYITDLGMTGPHDSVIGQEKQNIIDRFVMTMPVRFYVAKKDIRLSGVIVDVDEKSGKARKIERFQKKAPDLPEGENNGHE